jgi:hypothetical protein
VNIQALVEEISRIYSGAAYGLTVISGLLTIMVERFLYVRRGYRREAAITAFIGWLYVIGGTLLFLVLWLWKQWA